MQYKQKVAEILGRYGCYYLCIIYLAEKITGKNIDPIFYYKRFVENGCLEDDCYVNRPDLILSELTGLKYIAFHAELKDALHTEDLVVLRYEWKQTLTALAHFVVYDKKSGLVEYDPLGDSNTVKHGKAASYRVFRRSQ